MAEFIIQCVSLGFILAVFLMAGNFVMMRIMMSEWFMRKYIKDYTKRTMKMADKIQEEIWDEE